MLCKRTPRNETESWVEMLGLMVILGGVNILFRGYENDRVLEEFTVRSA